VTWCRKASASVNDLNALRCGSLEIPGLAEEGIVHVIIAGIERLAPEWVARVKARRQ
jgi:hypothetical protein